MINAQALMETTRMTVVAGKGATNPDFVFPSVHGGAEAASLIPTVCADGTHASVIGLRMLKASKVVVLMFPSHQYHILQALDSDPFLKANAYARAHIRGLLPTLPRNFSFNCVSDCSQFATRDPPVTARQWYTALRHNVFVKVARRSSSRTSKGSTLRCFRVDNYISWFRQRVPVVFQHVSVRNFLQATIG